MTILAAISGNSFVNAIVFLLIMGNAFIQFSGMHPMSTMPPELFAVFSTGHS
jgi:hypothetical protein